MKPLFLSAAVAAASLSLISSVAMAGGMDRSGQDTSIILKGGNVMEFLHVSVAPTVTGTWSGVVSPYTAYNGVASGDVTPDYTMTTMAAKFAATDSIDVAIINDNPFGADVDWSTGTFSANGGTNGHVESNATTLLASYALEGGVSVYGGVKNQSLKMNAAVGPLGYSATGANSNGTGYVLGAAIQNPEIALKVALTYHAKVKHTIAMTETSALGTATSNATFYTPSSINFDFQTGVAENTLLFGSIRTANWTETDVAPNMYSAVTLAGLGASKSLLSYDENTTTYNVGLGRRFNETWSGAVTYGYEAAGAGMGDAFSPTNGNNKIGMGVTYTAGDLSATLAVQQVNMGDQTAVAAASGSTIVSSAAMSNNTGLVTALKISTKF